MPGRKNPTFTEVELEFMQIIWKIGEVSTDDMQKLLNTRGRDLTDGSIRKILAILLEKGHLEREKKGRGFVYRPTVIREQANKNMITDLLNRAFSGSAEALVAALLGSRKLKQSELDSIKRMIDRHEREFGDES